MTQATGSLDGRRVVVLGGTSGLGLGIATAAAAQGAAVVVVSSRQSNVDKALGELPGTATGHAVDLADSGRVEELFARLGDFDHLVYTAGEALSQMPIETLDLDAARAFFGLRFFGALGAVHAAVPHLRASGSITLTSGSAGLRGGYGFSLGAGICGAIEGLTRSLAVELAPLRVNAVAPGVVRSPVWRGMSEVARERMYQEVGEGLPAGRVGEVSDVAKGYVYCMTQQWATGTVLRIDGGTVIV